MNVTFEKLATAFAIAALSACSGEIEHLDRDGVSISDARRIATLARRGVEPLEEPWNVLVAITDAEERHFDRTGELCPTAVLGVPPGLWDGEEYRPRPQEHADWNNSFWKCLDGFHGPDTIHYTYNFSSQGLYQVDFEDSKANVAYPPFDTTGTREVLQVSASIMREDVTQSVFSMWSVVTDGGHFERR